MSVQDFINALGPYSLPLLGWFVLLPLVAYGYGRFIAKVRSGLSPHKYVYSALIYLASIPGIFAGIITGYSLLILRQNLLQVNVVLYLAPIISMAATIIVIRKHVALEYIPGFHRLYGLFIAIAASFIIALIVMKSRIFIFFGSSFLTLIIIFAALLAAIQYASRLITTGRPPGEDKPKP